MLGAIAIREGDDVRAKAWLSECLRFVQQIGVNNQLAECLIGFANRAHAEKRFERAARLVGAAKMQIEARQDVQGITDRAELNHLTSVLREELGEVEF